MLVLTRACGEDVVVGGGLLTIRVLEVRGSRIRLGIEAPSNLPVHRREIYDSITKEGGRDPVAEQHTGELIGSHQPEDRLISVWLPSAAAVEAAVATGFVRFEQVGGGAVRESPKAPNAGAA
jgi:carbon storage regulator